MIKSRKGLEDISPYFVPPYTRMDKIRLDLNESSFGCSKKVFKSLSRLKPLDSAVYPEYEKLNKKIASEFKVKPENVLVTNGGDDAIRCVVDTFSNRDEEIIIPVPNYSMFELYANLSGIKVKKIQFNDDFSFPLKQVLNGITGKTKMIVIVNPASPLGTVLSRKKLIDILEKAKDSIVLLDETYFHFSGESNADLINKYKNLVVIQTFSKIYGLAAARIGFILANEKVLKEIFKVAFPYPVSSFSAIAAYAALCDKKFTSDVLKKVNREKEYLVKSLKKIADNVIDTHTNFILAKFRNKSDLIYKKLNRKGILVKNIGNLPMMKDYLRISIGNRKENDILLKTLADIFPPDVILFDMDGVLIDESLSYRMAIMHTAEFFTGKAVSEKEILSYKEKGGLNDDWALTEAIIKSRGITIPFAVIKEKFQVYYQGNNWDGFICNEKTLIEKETLIKLKKYFRLGIVTGRPREECDFALKKSGLNEYFEITITTDDVNGKTKPHPYGITLALSKLKTKNAIYIGDNVDDISAANGAGIPFIGIAEENSSLYKKFKKSGAVNIIPDVNHLPGIII
jgi:histidinol-phosphate aminotransferase